MIPTTLTRRQRCIVLLGSIGPCGFLPASGTMTVAILGLPGFFVLDRLSLSVPLQILLASLFAAASVWIHDIGDRILGEKDSRRLVWDELAGFWIALIGLPFTWQLAVLAFFLERGLDVAKVPPANLIENKVPGGWGVVGDDLVAGAYTCAILHLAIRWAPQLVGLSP